MYQDESLNVKPFTPELLPLAERFSSGNTYIDKYLQDGDCSLNHALGRTYVFLPEGEEYIIGFYSLGVSSVDCIEKGSNYERRKRIGGAININYFALDERFHKQAQINLPNDTIIYLSDLLLDDCLQRIENIVSEYIGAAFITLNSTKQGYKLYIRSGFEPLDNDTDCAQLYKWVEEEW